MSRRVLRNHYYPRFPEQPEFVEGCQTNVIYKTLPEGHPTELISAGPASMKHLYGGPNYYPVQHIQRPVGTMYESDLSMYHVGVAKDKRISYHHKAFPLTNRHVREVREYADYILPYMDFRAWTKHPVKREQSLNSKHYDDRMIASLHSSCSE